MGPDAFSGCRSVWATRPRREKKTISLDVTRLNTCMCSCDSRLCLAELVAHFLPSLPRCTRVKRRFSLGIKRLMKCTRRLAREPRGRWRYKDVVGQCVGSHSAAEKHAVMQRQWCKMFHRQDATARKARPTTTAVKVTAACCPHTPQKCRTLPPGYLPPVTCPPRKKTTISDMWPRI